MTDEQYFNLLPQPVVQIDELQNALEKHGFTPKLWISKTNMYDKRLYLNYYEGKYQVCILEVYGTPGYEYLFDNFFLEFNLQERDRSESGKPVGYTPEDIQELKTAKFKLCEKLNQLGLVDPKALYRSDREVSLWRPDTVKVSKTKPEDRKI
ncbi:MAG TPA: hypothetical protein VM577_15285 [Anaerovoracaceae bacterium]|nr:hypothetical protein [Anaerovoracaceae bacterium]